LGREGYRRPVRTSITLYMARTIRPGLRTVNASSALTEEAMKDVTQKDHRDLSKLKSLDRMNKIYRMAVAGVLERAFCLAALSLKPK
jgi:hypothetical protein